LAHQGLAQLRGQPFRLLRHRLHRHEPHIGAAGGFADCLSGSLAKKARNCDRRRFSRSNARPDASTPRSVNTAFDVSTPIRLISPMDGSSLGSRQPKLAL
jgi:hypothetical protein